MLKNAIWILFAYRCFSSIDDFHCRRFQMNAGRSKQKDREYQARIGSLNTRMLG